MAGVAATLRPRGDQAQAANLPQADSRPEPGLLEQAGAAMRVEVDRVDRVQDNRLDTAYLPLVDALVERGIERRALTRFALSLNLGVATIGDDSALDHARIWREAKRLGIDGLPGTQEDFERQVVTRQGERAADQDIMARGGGVAGTLAQFAGGMVGSMADPVNIATLPLGGAGKTAASRILSEMAVGASVEAAQALGPNRAAYARMGEEYGLGEAAQDIALAGAAAGAFRGAVEIAPKVDAVGVRALAPVRERFDRFFADRDLARALADVPADQLTPEQAAARTIFTRELELEEASPYTRTHVGDAAHRARLSEAGAAIAEGRVPAAFDMMRYLSRNRSAESGGDDTAAAATSSAFGRYQFLRDTWLEFYRRTFGDTGESRDAILQKRASGAVQDQVMRTFTQANVDALQRAGVPADEGSAYLAHFLGLRDAIKVLRAAPDTPIGELVTRASIEANPAVFRGVGSASELAAWARRKMGDDNGPPAQGVAARPMVEEPEPDLVMDAIEAEELELASLNNGQFRTEMVELMRPIVANPAVSLNRSQDIATALGLEPRHVTDALDTLAEMGALQRTRSGIYRRRANEGPEDMLLFLARKGGLAYDGLGPKARAANANGASFRGHDLKNTGVLDYFVPRGGPLLRQGSPGLDAAGFPLPGGRGLDDAAELLWEAGYFGPPEVTPRPGEAEVIELVQAAIRSPDKVYSFYDVAPDRQPGPGRKGARFTSDEEENFERVRWGRAAMRVFGRDLTDEELFEALVLEPGLDESRLRDPFDFDERMEETLWNLTSRQVDDVLEDVYGELGDEFYASFDATYDAYTLAARAGAQAADGAAGSAPLARDAGEGGPGRGERPGAARPDALDPARLDPAARDARDDTPQGYTPNPDNPALARFDEPAGEGVQGVAASDWHDIRLASGAAAEDPNIAARRRDETQLRVEAPMRGANTTGQEQDGTMGLGLFDAADQPTFDLEDGKGPRTASEIEAEIGADRAAIEEIRKCLM